MRSPDGAQRNPGTISQAAKPIPDFAARHPGYWRHFSVVASASENASSVRSSRSGVTDT
jgi:hypothetical protein